MERKRKQGIGEKGTGKEYSDYRWLEKWLNILRRYLYAFPKAKR